MAVVQYKNFSYLKGPKGDQGPKGDRGDRGPKGDQGPIGLTGPIGNINYNEVRSLFSANGPITYDSTSGVIGFNTTGFATETYVNNTINNLIGNAPQALNTLNELANALNDDANFGNTVITSLSGKLALSGGTMTGALTLNADPSTELGAATKQYVDNATSSIVTSYNDLTDKPDLFSGSYDDLTSKPTIPVVPTTLSSFSNDSGYITNSALTGYATESWVQSQGYGNSDTILPADSVGYLINDGSGNLSWSNTDPGISSWGDITLDGGTFEGTDNFDNSDLSVTSTDLDNVTIVATPLTSNSPGETGQIAYDNDYVYICIATNTWKRSALTSW